MDVKDEDGEKYDITLVKKQQGFDQREKSFQRVFWVLTALFLAGGLLGAFGDGFLSKGQAEGNGFKIEYEKLVRLEMPTAMHIMVNNPEKRSTAISINNEYLKNIKIEQVVPQPESVVAKKGQSVFNFKSNGNGLITFYLQPQHSGPQKLEIAIQGEKKQLNQFVYL